MILGDNSRTPAGDSTRVAMGTQELLLDPAERLPPRDDDVPGDRDFEGTPDPGAPLDATLLSAGLDPLRLARLERLLTQSMQDHLAAIEELAS